MTYLTRKKSIFWQLRETPRYVFMLLPQVTLTNCTFESPLLIESGYPVATVPIGQLRYNGRPFGLCLVARADEEETLLRFMAVYEKVAKPRPVPNSE